MTLERKVPKSIERAKRILLIDDDQDVRDYIQEALEGEGYGVDSFTAGETALEELETSEPRMALVDLSLPGMDGFHLIEALKARRPQLPVLVISAHSQADYKAAAEIAGADHFITKPFRLEQLLSEVNNRFATQELRVDQKTQKTSI